MAEPQDEKESGEKPESEPLSNGAETESQENHVDNLSDSGVSTESRSQDSPLNRVTVEKRFGLSLEVVYRLAVKFFRDNEGKAFHTSYGDRLKLAAFTKQVTNGPFDEAHSDVGYFDFIGNDRKAAWQALRDLSKEECMAGFVTLLDSVCPPFRVYIEANKRDIDAKDKEAKILEETERKAHEEQARIERLLHEQIEKQEAQKKQIQEALNRQTYHEFLAYAHQQFPNDAEQQQTLIKQLQDQHYTQYMQQVVSQYAQQPNGKQNLPKAQDVPSDSDGETDVEECRRPSNPDIEPASMWTRKEVAEFKDSIRQEGTEGILKIGSGETVTVRVPTHEDGSRLFWEFATDSFDLGFGVFFEWTAAESNDISVHIAESEEEDELEPDSQEGKPNDIEKAPDARNGRESARPRVDEVVPVYRRDCHEEVYAGSHSYPIRRGVYLLKFDNSYSLWRAKTLFYRVYYSR